MFRHKLHEHVSIKVHFNWFLLSFLAGSINAGGFLACQRFVSHVTGFATLAGVEAAKSSWSDAFAVSSIPAFFLGGVILAGVITDGRIARGKRPLYHWVMATATVCIALVTLGGTRGWFGEFGTDAVYSHDYFLLVLLCAASGLENAAVSSASVGTLRTTHLTGMTTDLGLGLVRSFYSLYDERRSRFELAINTRRILAIASFFLGSLVSAAFFLNWGYWGFAIPLTISLYLTAVSFREHHLHRHEQINTHQLAHQRPAGV